MTLKKALLRGLFGLPMGAFISTLVTILISATLGTGKYIAVVPSFITAMESELGAITLQFVLSCLLGFAFAASSAIFEAEHWSITKQTLVHALIVSVSLLPVAFITHWMEHSVKGFAMYFGIFALMYAVIWIAQRMAWKRKLDRINHKISGK